MYVQFKDVKVGQKFRHLRDGMPVGRVMERIEPTQFGRVTCRSKCRRFNRVGEEFWPVDDDVYVAVVTE